MLARHKERYTTIFCHTITTCTRIASSYETMLDRPRTKLENMPGRQRALTLDDGQFALVSLLRQFLCRCVCSAVVTGKRLLIAVESNN